MKRINSKSTNKALFKNTGIIAIGQISTRIINFFLLPLYTTLLSKEEYGTVDLLSTYVALLVVIVGLQMNQSVFRFIVTKRENREEITEIVSAIIIATLGIFIVYTVGFLLALPFITVSFKWYLLLSVIANITYQTISSISRGLGDNKTYALSSFISSAIIIILNILFIAVLRLSIAAMLSSYIIGPIIGTWVVLVRTRCYMYIRWRLPKRELMKQIFSYSIPLVPNELSWAVIHSSDRWVISTFISLAANGIIAVASKFSSIYTTFFSIFNTSWTEQVVLHYNDEGGPEYVNEMFSKMVVFFGSIAIGIIAFMPFIFGVLVSDNYNDAYGLIPFYIIAVFFNAVIGMISAIYLVHNETKQVASSTVVAAIINLVTGIILVKVIGVAAAPISSIFGYLTISIWRLIDINKRHCRISLPFRDILFLIINLLISIISFYSESIGIQAIVLVVFFGLALYVNQEILSETVFSIFRKSIEK